MLHAVLTVCSSLLCLHIITCVHGTMQGHMYPGQFPMASPMGYMPYPPPQVRLLRRVAC